MQNSKIITLIQALTASTSKLDSRFELVPIAAQSYLLTLQHKILCEGKVKTVAHYKALHHVATCIATRQIFSPIPFCKTTKDGIPCVLSIVKLLLTSDNLSLVRWGLTITRFYESIVTPVVLKLDPIVNMGPEVDKVFLSKFRTFVVKWTKKNNIYGKTPEPSEKVGSSLVQGPNGPAVIMSHLDAKAVYEDSNLFDNIRTLSEELEMEWIPDMIERIVPHVPETNLLHSRISLLQVGGGKTRTIGIGDYWSQCLLRPIHDFLMKTLRGFETDGTYNQEAQVTRITRLATNDSRSFDLTEATSRFPVDVIEMVMKSVFSDSLASAWKAVITDREFHYKSHRAKYARGTPMGLLTSWAAFALTHHALICYCAFEEGFETFSDYAVLGDDVVIWNLRVADRYSLLINALDVEININKSMISDVSIRRIEFAKRIIFNESEITGLRWDILHAASNSIYMHIDLVRVARMRNWDLTWSSIQAPSSLSAKGKELLAILLFANGGVPPVLPYKGGGKVHSPCIEDLNKEINQIRYAHLVDKLDSQKQIQSMNKFVQDLFQRGGISIEKHLIGLDGADPIHPIFLVINQSVAAMWKAKDDWAEYFYTDSDSDDDNEDSETIEKPAPEVLPIEYLPLPSAIPYFGKRHSLLSIWRSSIVLKAWFNLQKRDKKSEMIED